MTITLLRATLDVPFECAFTRAGTMNSLPTYRAPPIPTLQGLIYAALGRPSLLSVGRHSADKTEEAFRERVREKCRFGVRICKDGIQQTSLRQRHKASRPEREKAYNTYVAQTETLISPTFRMYVSGPIALVETFADALRDPERLLYLGRSDDLVEMQDVDVCKAERVDESANLDCVIPGTGDGDPSLLPVEPDQRDGRTQQPARVKTVSLDGGEVESYYETTDGEQVVFLT